MSKLQALQSDLLSGARGVRHGFFTRHGGVSRGPYDSLNVGLGSKDQPSAVIENRRLASLAVGAPPEALTTCYQVHSARVQVAARSWQDQRPEGDGVVTARPGVLCGVLSADCAPVLLADRDAGVVAAVHAGWRGAVAGVVGAAIRAMVELGAEPPRILAAIGPCIAPNSYEVGPDLLATFTSRRPESDRFFQPGRVADKYQFDLPGFVADELARAGVLACEWVGLDTFAGEDDFFSCRRAQKRLEPDYGRLLSVVMLDAE